MNLTFGKWFHNVKNKSKIVLTFDKIILQSVSAQLAQDVKVITPDMAPCRDLS